MWFPLHACPYCRCSSLELEDNAGRVKAGVTDTIDHVSDGDTPDSTVLCELTRHFHPVLSPSCVAEDSRSEKGFKVCLDRGYPHLQLASSLPEPHARRFGQTISNKSRKTGLVMNMKLTQRELLGALGTSS